MSCGCVNKEKKYKTKDTQYYRRIYHIWRQMNQRCYNKINKNYNTYGERGIFVCNEWKDFGKFYNDMIDSYSPGLTIERVDIDDGYKKSNCCWIKNEEQAKNRISSIAYRKRTGFVWKYGKIL